MKKAENGIRFNVKTHEHCLAHAQCAIYERFGGMACINPNRYSYAHLEFRTEIFCLFC